VNVCRLDVYVFECLDVMVMSVGASPSMPVLIVAVIMAMIIVAVVIVMVVRIFSWIWVYRAVSVFFGYEFFSKLNGEWRLKWFGIKLLQIWVVSLILSALGWSVDFIRRIAATYPFDT
jgi:hypothetical protein